MRSGAMGRSIRFWWAHQLGASNFMQKILTLGACAMALALSMTVTGCTGDDDDDAGSGDPGGIFNVTITSGGAASSSSSYAEFYSDYIGTFSSLRDVPLDTCINPLTPSSGGDPVIADAGPSVTAVSGATTLTYAMDAGDGGYYLAADVAGAPDDADYAASAGTLAADLGTISVPSLPGPVSANGTTHTATWTAMGADDAFVLFINASFTAFNLCHTADDGSYDFTALAISSGAVAVAGANYGEADLDGRSVLLIGQAGSPGEDTAAFGP